jgi:hypothetical protein
VQDAEAESVLAAARTGGGSKPAEQFGADQAVLVLAEQILQSFVAAPLPVRGLVADDGAAASAA